MTGRATNEPANYFAFGKQTAKDTEATTFTFLRHLDGTGLDRDDNIESVSEGGDGPEVGLRYRTAVSLDGQAVFNARSEPIARLLAAIQQSDAVSTPASGFGATGCQIHTAVPTHAAASNPYYFTLEQAFGDEVERVSNAQVNQIDIEYAQGQPIKFTAGFLGGGTPYFPTAAQTPTRETGPPLFYPNASIMVDGAANTKMTKAKISVKRGLDGDIRTVSLHREDVVGLTYDVDVDATFKYEDKTLYRKIQALGGSQIPLSPLGLATGSLKIYAESGSVDTLRFFEANLPVFQYTGARLNKLDPDGKTVYIDVVGMGLKGATHQFWTRVQTASGGAF